MNKIDWSEIISDEDLVKMYKSNSLRKMDKILGVSYKTIWRKLCALGVPMRKIGGQCKT